MKKRLIQTPAIVSAILLLLFASAFAVYNTSRESDSQATGGSSGHDSSDGGGSFDCDTQGNSRRFFLNDISVYNSISDRILYHPNSSASPSSRTFSLPDTIEPGTYNLRTVKSDHHYIVRGPNWNPSSGQNTQKYEQYYLEIDGTRTQSPTTDFIDNWDWSGNSNEKMQDPNENVNTVPSQVRDWDGEAMGQITITNATNKVTATHRGAIDNVDERMKSSVVPSGIFLECVDVGEPQLEVEKNVDGNGDGSFDPELESTRLGNAVTWEVVGTNNGDADDPNVKIETCQPAGTSLVAGSFPAAVAGGTITGDGSGCLTWNGPLNQGASVTFTFETVLEDFSACDTANGVDGLCDCSAIIHSAKTATTANDPADVDDAAVQVVDPDVTIDKTVDGNGDDSYADSEEINLGDEFTWRVTTTNNSDFDAEGVRVLDAASTGVEYISASVNAGLSNGDTQTNSSVFIDSSKVRWDGTLAASGGTVTIDIVARISDKPAFDSCRTSSNSDLSCINLAEVFVEPGDGNYELKDDDTANVIRGIPVVDIEKDVDVDGDQSFSESERITYGQEFVWRIVLTNTGTLDATDLTIDDAAPSGVSFVSASVSEQVESATIAGPTLENDVLSWQGSLDATPTAKLVIEVVSRIDDETAFDSCDGEPLGGLCLNEALVKFTETDEELDKDDATVTKPLKPNLSVVKAVDGNGDSDFTNQEAITVGSTFEWRIIVSNAADAGAADPARVVDNFDVGYEVVDATVDVGSVNFATSQVVWDGALNPGDSATIIVTTRVADGNAFLQCDNSPYVGNTASDDTCHDLATAGIAKVDTTDEFEGDTVEDAASVTSTVRSNITIVKEVDGIDNDADQPGRFSDNDPEEINVGSIFTWRISAGNSGDVTASGIRIVDAFPASVPVVSTVDDIRNSAVVSGNSSEGTIALQTVAGVSTVTWDGDLDPGASLSFEVNAFIADAPSYDQCVAQSSLADLCENIAKIGKSGPTPTALEIFIAEDPAYVFAELGPRLVIDKTVDGDGDGTFGEREPIPIDETPFRWRVVGCNVGEVKATNVEIHPMKSFFNLLLVPDSVTIVGDVQEGTITQLDGFFTWQGDLDPGSDGCIEIEFETTATQEGFEACDGYDGTFDGNCSCLAEIGVNEGFSSGNKGGVLFTSHDIDDAVVYTEEEGRLSVQKTVDGDNDGIYSESETITLGETYSYKVVVTNEGGSPVENAAMYDALPKGVVLDGNIELSPSDYGVVSEFTGDRYLIMWSAGELGAGDSVEITFDVLIADPNAFNTCDQEADFGPVGDEICTNVALVGTGSNPDNWVPTSDPDPAHVDRLKQPILFINKTVDGTDQDNDFTKFEQVTTDGSEFTYRVIFGNVGDVVAQNVTMNTGIPDGLTYVSHSQDPPAEGTLTFNEASQRLTWVGDLASDQQVTVFFLVKANNADQYQRCDEADGTVDLRCVCTATLSHSGEVLSSFAEVTTDELKPDVNIDKVVDGDRDGNFSEDEEVNVGDTIDWQVRITNNGDADANNLKVTDALVPGMTYIVNSIEELEGADLGVTSLKDNNVQWVGDLPAGETVVLQFSTTFESLDGFQRCNFSDGNADDERCTNPVKIISTTSGEVLGTDDAKVNTDLPSVLAYTGAAKVNYVVVIGVILVSITAATAIIAYVTRPRMDGGGPGELLPIPEDTGGGSSGSSTPPLIGSISFGYALA